MRPPRRPRSLTEGEARLWGEIARLVTPLRGRATPVLAPERPPVPGILQAIPAAPLQAMEPGPQKKPAPPPPGERQPKPSRPSTAASYQAPTPLPAASAGLERRARQALRRGRLQVDARIDLHGMYQGEAHGALIGFLLRARQAGHAYVLVVTGKGSADFADASAERGVLRRSVPHWLRAPELRGIVLGFEEASRHHGGAGALYIRLRRR